MIAILWENTTDNLWKVAGLTQATSTNHHFKIVKKTNRPYYNWKRECNKKTQHLATNINNPNWTLFRILNVCRHIYV